MRLEVRDVSESSLLVEFPDAGDVEANRAAVALAEHVRRQRLRGVLDAVPGARTLFVVFDRRSLDRRNLARRLRRSSELALRRAAPLESRVFRLPVCYGAQAGPDLSALARERGISAAALARRHAAAEYRVSFLGFSPGFAYLTGLPRELAAPRRETPRPRVPAGSVGIGGEYTAVYPDETPGGWHLVGRSPARIFDPQADPPALLEPGDLVRFDPIGEDELARRLAARARPEAEPLSSRGSGEAILEVIAPGLFTSVQGAPRFGLGSSGVPAGGAMDPEALARGNATLGNARDAAAVEMTLSGPELLFRRDRVVYVAGADLDARWNGRVVAPESAIAARGGDRLEFGRARRGARAYLCVEGGLAERGAAETTRRIAKGELLAAAPVLARSDAVEATPAAPLPPDGERVLRVLPGPQAAALAPAAAGLFFSATWRVSAESDRRGIRLEGPAIELQSPADIPPEGTALGAIQVPASGQPIVLGPDRPVTGGYVKIGTVVARDWPLLAQAPPGTAIAFRAADFEED